MVKYIILCDYDMFMKYGVWSIELRIDQKVIEEPESSQVIPVNVRVGLRQIT